MLALSTQFERKVRLPLREIRNLAELTVFFEDAVNVVLLERCHPDALLSEARRLMASGSVSVMLAIEPTEAGRVQLAARLPDAPLLAGDVRHWAEVLCDLTGCPVVGVRLARLESAMCPRFHVDKVTVRLVATYLGPGTELLEGDGKVRQAPDSSVVFLKGEAWPGNNGRGAVHRSPAASATEPRLVLTLDALA